MFEPQLILNYYAIVAAVLANMILGAVWYGPALGNMWAAEAGFTRDKQPDRKMMMRGMVLTIVGTVLTALILAHYVQIWRPSVWGQGMDEGDIVYAVKSALFIWLGFYVPAQLNLVGFEQKSWRLFAINSGYQLVSLLVMSLVLGFWR